MKSIIEKTGEISDILKNFSNKNKLSILCFLGKDKKNVTDIMKCSQISQSQISQYLGKMKLEGLLDSEKKGKEVYYSIKDERVLELISSFKKIFK